MSCCCSGACPCPNGSPPKCQTGGYWRRGICSVGPTAVEEPCCLCEVEFTKDQPHAAWAPYNEGCGRFENKCDRECDPEQAGERGSWTYTYAPLYVTDPDGNLVPVPGSQDTSKPTSRTWDGACPDGVVHTPALPDLIECECQCRYDFYPNLCAEEKGSEDWGSDPDPNICDCKCILTDSECVARDPAKPKADNENGNCGCICDKQPEDCKDDTPTFNAEKCECYCDKLDADGNHTCSGDTPDFNAAICDCYCATTSCPEGERLVGCECVPCPNTCNGCETQDPDCNCTGCDDCSHTAFEWVSSPGADPQTVCCPPKTTLCATSGSCVSTDCPSGQSYQAAICECDCNSGQEKCQGKCYPPCDPDESRDADCACYDSSAQSLLAFVEFLP